MNNDIFKSWAHKFLKTEQNNKIAKMLENVKSNLDMNMHFRKSLEGRNNVQEEIGKELLT